MKPSTPYRLLTRDETIEETDDMFTSTFSKEIIWGWFPVDMNYVGAECGGRHVRRPLVELRGGRHTRKCAQAASLAVSAANNLQRVAARAQADLKYRPTDAQLFDILSELNKVTGCLKDLLRHTDGPRDEPEIRVRLNEPCVGTTAVEESSRKPCKPVPKAESKQKISKYLEPAKDRWVATL